MPEETATTKASAPVLGVSIRFRRRCRKKLRAPALADDARGFNPLPASMPEETRTETRPWIEEVVSIRFRRRCRKKRFAVSPPEINLLPNRLREASTFRQ